MAKVPRGGCVEVHTDRLAREVELMGRMVLGREDRFLEFPWRYGTDRGGWRV